MWKRSGRVVLVIVVEVAGVDSVIGDTRRRLVEIDDAVRALPCDAFALKHELLSEADTLRAIIAEQSTPTKNGHSQDG